MRQDPLRWIAEAAGYSDSERWWEHQFEERMDAAEAFVAVQEVMTALRAEAEKELPPDPLEQAREAHMRQMIQAAHKEGRQRIAVVVGAWHAPALTEMPPAKQDTAILKGLPRVKVAVTWVPWTHGRRTYGSGYGAGIAAPGYYEELWRSATPRDRGLRWLTRVAQLLRAEGLEGSTASVIEAARLAETLAALRGRPVPGLLEFNEAARAVFCFGDDLPLRLLHQRLIVGERLGDVPDETPMVPLQGDVRRLQKRLRLPAEADERILELDLRKAIDLDRSRLLHRLRLLDIPWGKAPRRGGKGTFREAWRLRWEPEFEVRLIEAALWGNMVGEAASARAMEVARKAASLPELGTLLETALLADLPAALQVIGGCVRDQAALSADTGLLLDALPPLANASRYGDVRQSDTRLIGGIVDGLVTRICVGLPAACASLNEDAAREMQKRLEAADGAIRLLHNAAQLSLWASTLLRLVDQRHLHGLVAGRAARLLLDHGHLAPADMACRLSLALSRVAEPAAAAAWIEGSLSGSGLLLVHHEVLWTLIDGWLRALSADHFRQMLPLLRRTFSTFPRPERIQLLERARSSGGESVEVLSPRSSHASADVDEERGRVVLPVLALILGIDKERWP
jgi:hypothetical protein